MKKTISVFILILVLHCLTACSLLIYDTPDVSVNDPTEPKTESQYKPQKPTTKPTLSASKENNNESSTETNLPILAEKIIYNQNDIVVTVTGIEYDGLLGPQIGVLIENNSTQNITILTRNSSVNGYMIDFHMSSHVLAGKKAYSGIVILNDNLQFANIDKIADIEFSLHIIESTSFDTIADSDQISLSTNVASSYIQTYDDSGVALYDENGIRIIAKGLSLDSNFFGPELILYIENNSDKCITIQSRDSSINGFMIDAIMSDELLPGKRIIGGMTFSSSRLEESKISDIETIETVFHIFDTNTWDTILDTNPITITVGK